MVSLQNKSCATTQFPACVCVCGWPFFLRRSKAHSRVQKRKASFLFILLFEFVRMVFFWCTSSGLLTKRAHSNFSHLSRETPNTVQSLIIDRPLSSYSLHYHPVGGWWPDGTQIRHSTVPGAIDNDHAVSITGWPVSI